MIPYYQTWWDGMKSKKEEVEKVLKDLKVAIINKRCTPINRDKNLATLSQLGITWKIAMQEMLDLNYSNYIKGPVVDRDYPEGDLLWVFKKRILGDTIYIKYKVLYLKGKSVTLLSFHFDE